MKGFILILLGASISLVYAQSPGGVKGTSLWFQTVPITGDLQGDYHWQDFSGDSVRLYQFNAQGLNEGEFVQGRKSVHVFNFHPALKLSKGKSGKIARLKHSNLAQATIFGVFAPSLDSYGKDELIFAVNSRANSGLILSKDKLIRSRDKASLDYGKTCGEDLLFTPSDPNGAESFKETVLRIVTSQKADPPRHGLWGEPTVSALLTGSSYSNLSPMFTSVVDPSIFGHEEFEGYSPELIIFSRILSPVERRKVESYLAVKYGITLKGSYLDSRGNLLWDISSNHKYHNRVTAIGYDRLGYLYQPVSVTSYEEAPYYAVQKDNDCYYEKNFYALSSDKRLLVMGREEGNPLSDGGYLIWGDNNGTLSTYTSSTDSLWHIMNRKWKIQGNFSAKSDSTAVRWNGKGLTVISKGFTDCIYQQTAKPYACVTTPALLSAQGSISFRCPITYPTFEAGYSYPGEESCRYGFKLTSDGAVYPILNQKTFATAVATGIQGKDLSISKTASSILLRINGTGCKAWTLSVPESVNQEKIIGILRTLSSEEKLQLDNVRIGGIGDTGFQAELSHSLAAVREFAPYSKNRTFLLIHPNVSGTIDTSNSKFIQCSLPDLLRGKTMFRNIFWDEDGSGSDLFTFAYYEGLSIDARVTPTSCQGLNPVKDGRIDLRVLIGTPLYAYKLTADSVVEIPRGTIMSEGIFADDHFSISGLGSGTYLLNVVQGKGTDIYGIGDALFKTYARDNRITLTGNMNWTLASINSEYLIGIEPCSSEGTVKFGFRLTGNKAYPLINGQYNPSEFFTVQPGDRMGLVPEKGTLLFYINDQCIKRSSAWEVCQWRPCVRLGTGETHLTGLTLNREALPQMQCTGAVLAENAKDCSVCFKIHVGCLCDSSLPNGVEKPVYSTFADFSSSDNTQTPVDEFLSIEKAGQKRHYHAVLEHEKAGDATLVVYDTSGRLVLEQQMEGDTIKQASFCLPTPGVYIVKVFSSDREHTRKLISH